MRLTCGCTIPFSEDNPSERYCATWPGQACTEDGYVESVCYGTLCDKHLVSYNAERCKQMNEVKLLGRGKL